MSTLSIFLFVSRYVRMSITDGSAFGEMINTIDYRDISIADANRCVSIYRALGGVSC